MLFRSEPGSRQPPCHSGDVDFTVLTYLKCWLSTREHPRLSVSHIETEINLFLTLPVPIALGFVVAAKLVLMEEFVHPSWGPLLAITVALPASIYVSRYLWLKAGAAVVIEQADALRAFVIGNLMNDQDDHTDLAQTMVRRDLEYAGPWTADQGPDDRVPHLR